MTLTIAAATAGLVGCDHFAPDPMAFTVVQGTPIVRICLPVEITAVSLKTYSDDDDHTGRVVWTAIGQAAVEGGAEFALRVAPPGMRVSREGTVDFAHERFGVSITASDSYGEHEFSAYLGEGDLEEDVWTDGYRAVDQPCVREPCPPGFACWNQWPQPTGSPTERDTRWTPDE
jgi:hypothetical protein